MRHKDEQMDEYIREKLSKLSHTPPRDPAQAAQTRTSFLAQVHALSPGRDLSAPVPLSPSLRLKGWINQVLGSITQKEGHRMLKVITALFVIGAMLFGGAGATVFAAQDALPNDALYPLKTATEDLRLAFALDTQSELDLLLNYSDRRVNEIGALVSMGEDVPVDVILRLTAEMELVDEVISELEEPELSEAIEEVGIHIRDRDRISWESSSDVDDDDLLKLRAAWTETEICNDPLDYYEQLALYEAGTIPEAPVCLGWEGTGEWVWESPGPYFRAGQPDDKGYHNRQEMPVEEVPPEEIIDPLTDAEIMSGTDGLLIEGSGAGPGGSGDAPGGPGSLQGNAANRDSEVDSVAGPHSFKGNYLPEDGEGPYGSNSQYPFLEYFNLPTPKGSGSGGGGGKK